MNNIFENLDGDMYELILFMDQHHPDILNEQINNKNNRTNNNYSFFLNTIFRLKSDSSNFEDKFITLFNIFSKYGHNINSFINKDNKEVNELLSLLIYDRTKNMDFIINQFLTYPLDKQIEINNNYNLLTLLFKNNCNKLINSISNIKELWNNEKINETIINYLSSSKNVELINLFYSITERFNKSNLDNLDNEQNSPSKNEVLLNSFIGAVNTYKNSPIKERNYVLIDNYINDLKNIEQDYKDSALNYCFYQSVKLFNYIYKKIGKPNIEYPLWMFNKKNIDINSYSYVKFNDKDIFYYLIANFKPTDFKIVNNNKEFFIDHLLETMNNLDVSLYGSGKNKNRNANIINSFNDYIQPYLNIDINGESLISREFKKLLSSQKSIFQYCSDFKNSTQTGLILDIDLTPHNFNNIIKKEFLNNFNIDVNYNLHKLNHIENFESSLLNTLLDVDLNKFFILNYHFIFSNTNDNINKKLLSNFNNLSFNENDLNNVKQIVEKNSNISLVSKNFYKQVIVNIENLILDNLTKESSNIPKIKKL